MIPQIRSFLAAKIKEVNSDLSAFDSAFYDGDIGETALDRVFQITIANMSNSVSEDNYYTNEIDVMIKVFGIGGKEETDQFDCLFDDAKCIHDNIMKISSFSGVDNITNIVSGGINASQLPENDNAFVFDINLTITESYSLGE
jgi:hypothetical protein